MASGNEVVRGRWAPDPIGKHEFRWHDDTSWTGWVTDANRQSFDPIANALVRVSPSKRFKNRRHALTRLFMGIGAIILGLGVAALILASSIGIVVVPAAFSLWGIVEVGLAIRYLVKKQQSSTVPTTDPPPPLDFGAEIKVLDDLLHRGKLSQHSYDLAAIKVRRKYNVAPRLSD